jgi:uncharacterized membrane protein
MSARDKQNEELKALLERHRAARPALDEDSEAVLSGLTPNEQALIRRVLAGCPRKSVVEEMDDERTLGQRLADRLASLAGSWGFITASLAAIALWIAANAAGLCSVWDPYPFILLNLVLSSLGAIQAPVIMMSQNRALEMDRRTALRSLELSIKAEVQNNQIMEACFACRQQRRVALLNELPSGAKPRKVPGLMQRQIDALIEKGKAGSITDAEQRDLNQTLDYLNDLTIPAGAPDCQLDCPLRRAREEDR